MRGGAGPLDHIADPLHEVRVQELGRAEKIVSDKENTTVIGGNCGVSAAPLNQEMDLPMPLSLMEAPKGKYVAYFEGDDEDNWEPVDVISGV